MGITLIETLVGVALGILVTLVIAQVWGIFEGQRGRTASGSTAQETGLIALTQIEQTVHNAGSGMNAGMFQCTWASSPGANSAISLLVNGATAWRICPTAATQLLVCALPIGALGLNAGDTLQVTASQGSGAAININPSQWQMWRLSA